MARRSKGRKGPAPGRNEIAASAPGAPEEGAEAGSDEDLVHEREMAGIREARGVANSHFAEAKRLLGSDRAGAESEARAAIDAAVRGFWRAEDTPLEEPLHRLMHRIGRWTREHFGCFLHFDGEKYEQRCPLAIAHKRFGFSIGFTAQRICSICGEDLSECPHIRGRAYWVRGGRGPSGHCPVCMEEDCEHSPETLHRVSVVAIIKEMRGRELSVVRRPAFPEARMRTEPISTADLAEHLGEDFRPGIEVSCDLCLGDCWGFTEIDPGAGSSSVP